jgi:hypothetical protein
MVLLQELWPLLQDIDMPGCCDKIAVPVALPLENTIETETDFLLNKDSRSAARMAICQTCPELGTLNRCRQCGCFMSIKTRIASAKCPLNLW